MKLGRALLGTVRHYFPEFNHWLDDLPDHRCPQTITYDRRFLAWWGIALYLLQLGSRRQLDFDLDARDTHVLDNFNRLAQTAQTSRPVHDTLDYHYSARSVAGHAVASGVKFGRRDYAAGDKQ